MSWMQLARWEDAVDILAVAVLAWLAIRYLRRTRVRTALLGLAMLGVVYAAATALELRLTAALFQAFFAVVVLVLVVVFQEDLRRFFEQLGSWRPGRRVAPHAQASDSIAVLARAVSELARLRTGALVVLPRHEPLERHLEGGTELGGRLSESLLLSLFDASSPGHDGAVILRGDTVDRFAVHLPLSVDHAALRGRGCRHAAALGLAELCDAVCVVVSEERGTVSIARDGEMHEVAPDRVAALLREAFGGPAETADRSRTALVDAGLGFASAVLVWLVFVPGSDEAVRTLPAQVELANLPGDMQLESIEPAEIEVTLRGLRRDLVLVGEDEVRVHVDAYLARFGRRTFAVSPGDVHHPEALTVTDLSPEKLRISLQAAEPEAEGEAPAP